MSKENNVLFCLLISNLSDIFNIILYLESKENASYDIKILLNGLKLVGDYLDKTILKPNNLIIIDQK